MSKVFNESDWVVTCNRYVAYFDIMGFKNMVSRVTHDEIYNMMKNINNKIKANENMDWLDLKSNLIKTTTYSDSIIIYSKDDSLNSLTSLIATVAGLHYDLLTDTIPHKGAVAFGMMTLDTDKSIFFGQPLIDAYILQEELIFYGIIMHATFEQKMEEIKEKEQEKIPFIKNYLCPLKNGNSLHKTIAPLFAFLLNPQNNEEQIVHDKLFASCNALRFKTSGHLRKYIDNTELYLNTFKKG